MPSAKTARHRGARGQVSFENALRRPCGYVNLDVGEESKPEMDSLGGNGVQVLRGRSRGSTEVEKRVGPTPERRPPMDPGAGGRRRPSSEPSPGWSGKETGRKECQGGGVVNGAKAAESMKIKVTTRMSPRTPLSRTGTASGGDTPGGRVVKGGRSKEAARRGEGLPLTAPSGLPAARGAEGRPGLQGGSEGGGVWDFPVPRVPV